jgi:hypothetical protein
MRSDRFFSICFVCAALSSIMMLSQPPMCYSSGLSQQATMQFPNVIRKRAEVAQSESPGLLAVRADILVRVSGLRPDDVVNIRPSAESEVAAAAGTVAKTMVGERMTSPGDLLKPGGDLPGSSLRVKSTRVIFSRPDSIDGNAFLDVQVPRQAHVELVIDGKTLLNAVVLQPICLCAGEWDLGATGLAGTVVRATGLLRQPILGNREAAFDKGTGLYAVPYSKLRLNLRKPLVARAGSTVLVLVHVDETGKVVKATPLTESGINNLPDSMLEWRFMPYVMNGRAIPFKTCIPVTVQAQ